MDFQTVTLAKLAEAEPRRFDPDDENAYYKTKGELPWLLRKMRDAFSWAMTRARAARPNSHRLGRLGTQTARIG